MTGTTTSQPARTTRTLDAPGATLTYDLRRNDASSHPPLVLVGTPMGALGFDTLAGYFTDRTVVTYDPRDTKRSTIAMPASDSEGIPAHRGGEAIAERLGTRAVLFPGDHSGFMGGEYGQTGQPEAFAAKLREVLAAP